MTQARLIDQGYYFRDAFEVFRAHAEDLFSVTAWGLTDGRSWRVDSGAPLIFDDRYQAKPAYYGAVGAELPARQRAANVFAGDVPLDGSATASPEWDRLPLHTFGAPDGGEAAFQLRWAADHLTAFVSVDDAEPAAGDAVTLVLGAAEAGSADGVRGGPGRRGERDRRGGGGGRAGGWLRRRRAPAGGPRGGRHRRLRRPGDQRGHDHGLEHAGRARHA